MKRWSLSLLILLFTIAATGCVNGDIQTSGSVGALSEKIRPVQVNIQNAQGKVIGQAQLTQLTEGVKIKIEVHGLTPGKHGFHIHENGVCEVPDFKSAGDHFNPTHMEHGFENPKGPHAGDLLNLEVDKKGNAEKVFISPYVTMAKGKQNSLFKAGGTSLVIHEKADDYKTNPSGNSGARIACGVIKPQGAK